MTTDQSHFVQARPGDPDFERILQIHAAMLMGAAIDQKSDDLDPSNHTALTITAAALLAGYLTGACIGGGILIDGDKKRAGDNVLRNFRQGIEMGKTQALRSMAAKVAGNA